MSKIIRPRNEGEPTIIPNGEPYIFSEGKIGAIVHYPVLRDEGEGFVEKTFEKYVRSPGTRIIAVKDNKIYLQSELRIETESFDWRLPGGKVIDRFEDYKQYFNTELPENIILEAAHEELREEAHLEAKTMKLFTKKVCGTTVQWDLFYIIAQGAEHIEHEGSSEGEEIQEGGWFTFDEVKHKCETGEIDEGRSVSALLQYMHENA